MYIANNRTTLHRLSSRVFSKRFINTKKPLFSGANRHARDLEVGQIPSPAAASTSTSTSASTSTTASSALKDTLEKARNDLLNKLGSNSSGTVVASAGNEAQITRVPTDLLILFCSVRKPHQSAEKCRWGRELCCPGSFFFASLCFDPSVQG